MKDAMTNKVESAAIVKHLREKWGGRSCPLCLSGSWQVADRVFELREFKGGGLFVGEFQYQPLIPVTCDNCGNTVLINGIVSKVVPKSTAGAEPAKGAS